MSREMQEYWFEVLCSELRQGAFAMDAVLKATEATAYVFNLSPQSAALPTAQPQPPPPPPDYII